MSVPAALQQELYRL